ncbi:hypothetical protein [Sphingomonas phyllosphaerae]|uniref:hypothetical protein n=1 Tax=Sphingomonas phyllosphaerae TaxID=257003 RepID=UPI00041191D6|nr:hypothetical protein [Sphingomonas phyllosphaerae]
MKRRKLPQVFRMAAALLLTTAIAGQWWQRQPAGTIAGWVPAMAEVHCPAAVRGAGTIADSARTLDRWGYAVIGSLVFRDDRDRCQAGENSRRG